LKQNCGDSLGGLEDGGIARFTDATSDCRSLEFFQKSPASLMSKFYFGR
jgi:hypothetical protein